MTTTAYAVALLLRGRLKPTGLLPLVHRSRVVRSVADDMTKCSTVCLQQRMYSGSCAVNVHFPLFTTRLHIDQLVCDSRLKNVDCLFSSSNTHYLRVLGVAPYSTKPGPKEKAAAAVTKTEMISGAEKSEAFSATDKSKATEEQLTLFQRFKKAYKEHGKVLIAVHVATSIVWFSSFYTAARCGIDIVPYLEQWGFSETFIKPFRAGGLGDIALAYLMYKLATPARYTVTLAGTNFAIKYLRRTGKMAPKSAEDSLRQLYKEGRQKLKDSKLRAERLQKIRSARKKKAEAKKSKK